MQPIDPIESLMTSAIQAQRACGLASLRLEAGGAIDPIATCRESGYRNAVTEQRPKSTGGSGGIV